MSDNVRVYEIAEEAGASSNDVILKAKDLRNESAGRVPMNPANPAYFDRKKKTETKKTQK